MDLATACAPYRRLAIAGTVKNAGKTTVLNHLVARFQAMGDVLGISSVGRDGEAIDQLTNQPKPRIHPPVGALVATSHDAMLHSRAMLERVATTPFRTALGPVAIYRVVSPGHVEVAGPVKVREAAKLMDLLADAGATRILLDGAADRRAFVACGVDGFVLATGLALAPTIDEVVAGTGAVLKRLQLAAPPLAWRQACGDLPGAITPAGFVAWPAPTFLDATDAFAAWLPADAEALYVPGAVGDGLATALLALRQPPALVVPAGTHLLAERLLLDRLLARLPACHALMPVLPVALTTNPTGPGSAPVDGVALRDALRLAFGDLPVHDVGTADTTARV